MPTSGTAAADVASSGERPGEVIVGETRDDAHYAGGGDCSQERYHDGTVVAHASISYKIIKNGEFRMHCLQSSLIATLVHFMI